MLLSVIALLTLQSANGSLQRSSLFTAAKNLDVQRRDLQTATATATTLCDFMDNFLESTFTKVGGFTCQCSASFSDQGEVGTCSADNEFCDGINCGIVRSTFKLKSHNILESVTLCVDYTSGEEGLLCIEASYCGTDDVCSCKTTWDGNTCDSCVVCDNQSLFSADCKNIKGYGYTQNQCKLIDDDISFFETSASNGVDTSGLNRIESIRSPVTLTALVVAAFAAQL